MLFSKKPRIDEFEAAALPHMNDIYRTAVRLLGGPSGADDVVQDVYLQAWKSFSQFELAKRLPGLQIHVLDHVVGTAGPAKQPYRRPVDIVHVRQGGGFEFVDSRLF